MDLGVSASQAYATIAIIAFLLVGVALFFVIKGGKHKRLSPMAGVALAFVGAGVVFGEDRLVGYGLLGIGMALAVADIFIKHKENARNAGKG